MVVKRSKMVYRVYKKIGKSWTQIGESTKRREADIMFNKLVKNGDYTKLTEGWTKVVERLLLTQKKTEDALNVKRKKNDNR